MTVTGSDGTRSSSPQGLGGAALDQHRAALVAVLLGVGQQFLLDQGLQAGLRAEHRFELLAFVRKRVLLVADLHFLELGQVPQLQFEDGLGLRAGELEALHQHRLGLVLVADDVDHLVDVQVGDQQAFEDVQAVDDLVEAVIEPPDDRVHAETEPLPEQFAQVQHLRLAVDADDVQVDAVIPLEVGGGEQVVHQLLQVDAVGARHDDQAGRVLVVGFVAQVLDHRQFLGLHLLGDLLQHLGRRYLVGQGGDDDLAVFLFPDRAHLDRAGAGFVHLQQFVRGGDDFRVGREIRAPDVLAELGDGRLGLLQQPDAGGHHLAQVVRRNVGGHADRDADAAVQQHVGQPRRQHRSVPAACRRNSATSRPCPCPVR